MMLEKQELDGAVRLNGKSFGLGKQMQSEDKVVVHALSVRDKKEKTGEGSEVYRNLIFSQNDLATSCAQITDKEMVQNLKTQLPATDSQNVRDIDSIMKPSMRAQQRKNMMTVEKQELDGAIRLNGESF